MNSNVFTHLLIGEAISDEQVREVIRIMQDRGAELQREPDFVCFSIDLEYGGALIILSTIWKTSEACVTFAGSRINRQLVSATQHLLAGNFVVKIFRRESGSLAEARP
jgi:hypothetical protein